MLIHDGDNVYEDRYVDADQLINGSCQTLALKTPTSQLAPVCLLITAGVY
jgi:hypothetical protein